MGTKSLMRSLNAIARQSERAARMRQRELLLQEKEYHRMQELQRAAYEVEVYENHIERITSVHKDCCSVYDWGKIEKEKAPDEPENAKTREILKRKEYDSYTPGFFDRLFKLENKKRAKLSQAIEKAIKLDEHDYLEEKKKFADELVAHNELISLAKKINSGNREFYVQAIETINPFSEINELGSKIEYHIVSPEKAKVGFHVHDDKVIPKQAKTLLKSGKLSVKDVPSGKYNDLYQDYVCSATIRIARDLLSILPLHEIIVTAKGNVLNSSTGRIEEKPLLSVLFIRETMDTINFDSIDPSDCMRNFKHNMSFKKSQGMMPTEELDFGDIGK
jgi:hypothetical protein